MKHAVDLSQLAVISLAKNQHRGVGRFESANPGGVRHVEAEEVQIVSAERMAGYRLLRRLGVQVFIFFFHRP